MNWGQNNQGWGNQGQQPQQPQQGQGWGNQGNNNMQNQGWNNQGNNGWGNQPQNQGNTSWGNQGSNGWNNQQSYQTWNNQTQNNNNNGWGNQFISPGQPSQNNSSWNQHKSRWNSSNIANDTTQGWDKQPQMSPYPQNNSGWGDQAKNQTNISNINNSAIKSTSKFDSNSQYIIVSGLANDMVLGLSQEEHTKNKGILCKNTNSAYHKFKIADAEGGKYRLTCSGNGMILQIPNSSSAKGVSVFGCYQKNAAHQFWQLVPTKENDGGFFIKSFCGKCLDVCEQKTVHGTPVIQYDYNGGKNQIWYFKQV